MYRKFLRPHLKRVVINLAPSAVILVIIALGAGMGVSWFELAWKNDVVFVLLAIALFLPLTKLPQLFFITEEPLVGQCSVCAEASAPVRAAQMEGFEVREGSASPRMRPERCIPIESSISTAPTKKKNIKG